MTLPLFGIDKIA